MPKTELSAADILAQAHLLAQEMAVNLPLPLHAKRSVRRGVHGQRRQGSGEGFWQFRDYQPGDASRAIDWRETGKRDRVFVREREAEMPQTVFAWRDPSPTMQFSSAPRRLMKKDYADILWCAAALMLVKAGERIGGLSAAYPPQIHASGLEGLYQASLASDAVFPPAINPAARGAHVLIISDFCRDFSAITPFFADLAALEVTATIVHIADPVEEDFPFKGHIAFHDNAGYQSDNDIYLPRAEVLRAEYQAAYLQHRARIENACDKQGWRFISIRTDHALPAALTAICGAIVVGEG